MRVAAKTPATYQPGIAWIPLQLAAVLSGHVLGAWAGHVDAERDAPTGVRIRLRQGPLAI